MATSGHEDQGELARPIKENGIYSNPFDTWKFFGRLDVLKWTSSSLKDNSGIPWGNPEELERNLPKYTPDFEKLQNHGVQVMWIGHASVLVKVDGITVLTDPVFSSRRTLFRPSGNKRYRDPPCAINDLPHIDAVVISHNHYDHLDQSSVEDLNKRFGPSLSWYVAEGQAQWMKDRGCKTVVELSWWDENRLLKNGKEFVFACTPSQHWTQRGLLDRNKALWCSWVIKGPENSFFFAGDTGYCWVFKQIGKIYGPFTLAAIPIGAYSPRWFMKPQHIDPEEAVQIHEDLRAKTSIGIHWGTFKMKSEPYMEPKQELEKAVRTKRLPPDVFYTLNHGEVKQL